MGVESFKVRVRVDSGPWNGMHPPYEFPPSLPVSNPPSTLPSSHAESHQPHLCCEVDGHGVGLIECKVRGVHQVEHDLGRTPQPANKRPELAGPVQQSSERSQPQRQRSHQGPGCGRRGGSSRSARASLLRWRWGLGPCSGGLLVFPGRFGCTPPRLHCGGGRRIGGGGESGLNRPLSRRLRWVAVLSAGSLVGLL